MINIGREITNVSIDVLKVHPRNTEFFDDISGADYENFKRSIKEEGIISEIIVAPDMTIISGHQRFKAARDLGIKMVPVRIREDLVEEDKKLKTLLAANFGRNKNDETKQRKVAVEYVRLCGYGHGGERSGSRCQNGTLTLDQIAAQLGTSKRDLQRALSIERNLTESVKELLDTGVITKTLAADTIATLSEQEQEELISKLDVTKRYTQKQVQGYIDEIRRLKSQQNVAPRVIEKIVDKTDYKTISTLRASLTDAEATISRLNNQKSILEMQANLNKKDADEYNQLKKEISFLTSQKNELKRQIASATELSGLTVTLQNVLERDLAPIKYKRCMEMLTTSEVAVQNLTEVIDMVESWLCEIKSYLPGYTGEIVDMPQ